MFSFTVFGNGNKISNSDDFPQKTLNHNHFQGPFYMVSITQANINRFKPFSQCLLSKYSRILYNALNEPVNLVNFFHKFTLIITVLHLFNIHINLHFFHTTMHLLDRPKYYFSMLLAFSVPKISLLVYNCFHFGRTGSNFPFSQIFGPKLKSLKPKRWEERRDNLKVKC